jgi:deoxycytidylate deaminase|tara:strand:+ start:1627 stop:2139 length:513 start_codon:yes stop_codon:yes gene_type:complete
MRPNWHEYFMASAFLASFRSHDDQSKVGAVLVNSERKEISRGYNGFCSGIEENGLDTTRPGKYKYIVHAEANALSNLVIKIDKASLYCTRMPCLNCSKLLWQNNVREWYVPTGCVNTDEVPIRVKNYSEEEEQILQLLLRSGLKISYVDFDMNKLTEIIQNNNKYFSYLG